MKYKIGDTVKIINLSTMFFGFTGKIFKISEGKDFPYKFKEMGRVWQENELELVKSAEEVKKYHKCGEDMGACEKCHSEIKEEIAEEKPKHKCEMVEIGSDLCQIKAGSTSLKTLLGDFSFVKLYQCPKCKTVVIK